MKILAIDCCARGEQSATRRLCERYLATRPEASVDVLRLYDEPIAPLRAEEIDRRAALVASGALDDPMLWYARQFRSADEIVIAAPYWDLSFPSVLKVYLERVCVVGITFGYEGAQPVGYCRAAKIMYFSTCGGYLDGPHLGAAYVRSLAAVLGIHTVEEHHIEGLDMDLSQRDALVEAGVRRILADIAAKR